MKKFFLLLPVLLLLLSFFFFPSKTYAAICAGSTYSSCTMSNGFTGQGLCTSPPSGTIENCSPNTTGVCDIGSSTSTCPYSACGSGQLSGCCNGGSAWTQYNYECVYGYDQSGVAYCEPFYQANASTCSIGDKCINAGDTTLEPGQCNCSYSTTPYKTCCTTGGSQVACIQENLDNQYPMEGYCPSGTQYKTVFCGGAGQPACGQAACNSIAPPITVSGTITNSVTGGGVNGVTVTITDTTKNVSTTATTGSNGAFSNSSLVKGSDSYTVTPNANTASAPCTGGYICGSAYSSPNPTSRNNCGTSCNFTYVPGSISGHVYMDYDHDGAGGTADVAAANVTVSAGGVSATTDSTGYYLLNNLSQGSYTVTLTVPAGDEAVNGTTTQTVSIGPNNTNTNFYVSPLYQISGNIFNDVDKSHCYNPSTSGCSYNGTTFSPGSDTLFTNGSHLKITGITSGTISTTADAVNGSYQTAQSLPSGTYNVGYDTGTTPLPSGYSFVGPYSWQVVVGSNAGSPVCNTGSSPDASCTNPNSGSIANLNFGVSNENVWTQPVCSDARFDNGYSQQIPSGANCGGTSTSYAITSATCTNQTGGILYSGATNPSYGQGLGASTNNTQVGNFSYPESYNNQIPNTSATSYSFVNTSLNTYAGPVTDLKNVCPTYGTNCTLSEAWPGGVYTATGPVKFSVSNVDGSYNLGTANYVFLVNGDITFTTNVLTQNGYSTTFVSSGDIHVAGNVGEADWTSTNPDLEGFFSANNNFILDYINPPGQQCTSTGQPKENKLNIVGSVITNAGGAGGSIVNNRDGCLQDLSCPALTVTTNPVMLLNASGLLKPPYTFWQEQNP